MALAILCFGAVTFLLRFLTALVMGRMRVPPRDMERATMVILLKF